MPRRVDAHAARPGVGRRAPACIVRPVDGETAESDAAPGSVASAARSGGRRRRARCCRSRPAFTAPDPRIDAVRGCLAVERGPEVFALESVDLVPAGAPDADVADYVMDRSVPAREEDGRVLVTLRPIAVADDLAVRGRRMRGRARRLGRGAARRLPRVGGARPFDDADLDSDRLSRPGIGGGDPTRGKFRGYSATSGSGRASPRGPTPDIDMIDRAANGLNKDTCERNL